MTREMLLLSSNMSFRYMNPTQVWMNPTQVWAISMYPSSLRSWNKSSDCCSWTGVKCDAKSGKVVSLSFIFIPLNNSFKPNSGLFKLQYLQNLTFYNCDLYGEIPSSLGNLSRLTLFELTQNNFVGPLPASIGNLTQLRYLRLSQNSFSGKIPNSFANLTKLSEVNLDNNYFESTLPPDMSRFHNLEYFTVSENSFLGSFPRSLLTNPSLRYVNLEGNQFKGPIELGNSSSLSRLQYLNLAHNKFDGSIPDSISEFSNLVEIDLSHNNFVDPIPISISTLFKLKFIDFSYNKFEGQVPGYLWGLTMVIISHNSFNSCEKPSKVVNETQIQALGLASNSFRGPFPYWICKLRSLSFLDLSNNSFSGSIPQCLRNFIVTLQELILHNNKFNGILPDIFVNATSLLSLDVSHNQLEGKLPRSLINSKALKFLNVENNRINEKFPSWLGSLPWLYVLILRSNKFYGPLYHPRVSVGFQSLRVIDISRNDFTGTLPHFYFSDWREMATLNEDDAGGFIVNDPYMDNGLHSDTMYSNSMEMVHKGVNTEFERIRKDLRAIDFSGNRFCGNIPDSIGLLKGLRLLNLSGNAFTSNIPRSLGSLTNLETLDLSRNQLSGQIPRDLGSLSFLSTMNFSQNSLQGPIPRGTQFQRQNCSSFMDNPKLNGLEDICGETYHVPNPTPQEPEDSMSEPEEEVISWIAAAIAYGPGVFCGLVIGHIFASHKHEWFMEKFGRNKPRATIRSTR